LLNNPAVVPDTDADGILAVLALVILPLLSTVITGTLVEVIVDDPYVFAVTPVFVNVPTPVTFPVPSKLALVYVISPVMPIVLPVVNALALDAVPLKVPVIVPVEKPPLTSLLTIVLGVLVEVAESTFEATVVIVVELTPPTLFTVGNSADPPKSLVNFKIPFTLDVASGADEFVILAFTKAVVAICVELFATSAVTAVGVPVNEGLEDNTTNPVPVELLVPVPPLATLNGVAKLKEVAVIVPVFNEVEEIFPDDTTDVAVIIPAAKPPLPSLFTSMFAVLDEVAESTFDATVVIVVELTPPTLFTVAAAVISCVPLNVGLV